MLIEHCHDSSFFCGLRCGWCFNWYFLGRLGRKRLWLENFFTKQDTLDCMAAYHEYPRIVRFARVAQFLLYSLHCWQSKGGKNRAPCLELVWSLFGASCCLHCQRLLAIHYVLWCVTLGCNKTEDSALHAPLSHFMIHGLVQWIWDYLLLISLKSLKRVFLGGLRVLPGWPTQKDMRHMICRFLCALRINKVFPEDSHWLQQPLSATDLP